MPMNQETLVVGEWLEIASPDIPGLGVFYFDSHDTAVATVDVSEPAADYEIGYPVTRGLNQIPVAEGKKLWLKLLSGSATVTWPSTEGYTVWRWDDGAWQPDANHCTSGYVPEVPSADGTVDGQRTTSFCVLPAAGGGTSWWIWSAADTTWLIYSDECGGGTPVMPLGDGDFDNEIRQGTCAI